MIGGWVNDLRTAFSISTCGISGSLRSMHPRGARVVFPLGRRWKVYIWSWSKISMWPWLDCGFWATSRWSGWVIQVQVVDHSAVEVGRGVRGNFLCDPSFLLMWWFEETFSMHWFAPNCSFIRPSSPTASMTYTLCAQRGGKVHASYLILAYMVRIECFLDSR